MNTVEEITCCVLAVTKTIDTQHYFNLALRLQLLVPEKDIVVPKIIHEPAFYDYRTQIFHPKRREIVPAKKVWKETYSRDGTGREKALNKFAIHVLGLFNYDTGTVYRLRTGMCFRAFLWEYRGKQVISRYHYDNGNTIFPGSKIWFNAGLVQDYMEKI